MTTKNTIILVVLVFVLGAAVGRFSLPAKVVEKEVTKYVDRIVEKKVYDVRREVDKNKVYVKTVTIAPDGTRTEVTRIEDKSKVIDTDKTKDDVAEDKSGETAKEKEVTYNTNNLIVSLAVKNDLGSILTSPSYGAMVQKRLIGPIYLGGFAFSDKTFGLNVGLSF